MGVSPAAPLCQQNYSQTVDGSGWSPIQGSFRFCSLTEFGGLISRGSKTVTEKDWSQALGHFRVHRLYGGLCLSCNVQVGATPQLMILVTDSCTNRAEIEFSEVWRGFRFSSQDRGCGGR